MFRLHALCFAVHLASGVLGVLLSRDVRTGIPVYGNYISYNLNAEGAGAVFSKLPPQEVYRFHTLWAFAAVEFITAAWHLLYVAELWWTLLPLDAWTSHGLRWAEYAVTATLLGATNVVATGGNDVTLLALTCVAGVALQACGYISELAWQPAPALSRLVVVVNITGFLLFGGGVGVIMHQIMNSTNVAPVWHQQTAAYGIYFASFGLNSVLRSLNAGAWGSFAWTERVYLVLSVTSKTSLFWLSTAGTRQVLEDRGLLPATPGVNWDAVRYSAMVLPGVAGLGALVAAYPPRAQKNQMLNLMSRVLLKEVTEEKRGLSKSVYL
jgi:hypothetical protein